MTSRTRYVNYEEFGAVGDGVADDLPAICKAHEYANEHSLPVLTKADAIYHLGHQPLTAIIATDTNWNSSRFTIDDTAVDHANDDHKVPLFHVRSQLEPLDLQLDGLNRDQAQIDVRPESDCYVLVEDDSRLLYIRRGLNQNAGVAQNDCFILRRDGSIEGSIDWAYERFSRIDARPMDEAPLVLRGGIFTTFANRLDQEVGYNYWARNIEITRSNTTVDGLTHYVVGETAVGHPYRGFLNAFECANITFRNCFATPHKTYTTIGAAGKPVSMGSYDMHANHVVNFHLANCTMHHICDSTHWGVIATNFCKNILLEDCTLSRMDTHMGVSGTYTVRRCSLGHMGLKAIGRGQLTVEDSALYGHTLVEFRSDYGSTWEGDLVIRNSRWTPSCGAPVVPYIIGVHNDGMHDFGYPCSMPQEITIDGLIIDDSNHPDGYEGPYLFTDPDSVRMGLEPVPLAEERPFPYQRTERITISGLETASGKQPLISPNIEIQENIVVNRGQ